MAIKKYSKSKLIYQEEVKKQRSIKNSISHDAKRFQKELADRLLKLVTSGFGLVAALAWNELIKEIISQYVEPIFGGGSGLISLFIYAFAVTFLAVMITYQLSKIVKDQGKED